jgi:hypothetical protein
MHRSIRWIAPSLAACALLVGSAAAMAAGPAVEIEELIRKAYGLPEGATKYRDLGGGFHSLSLQLPPEYRARLAAAAEADGAEATTLFLLGTGVQPTNPVLLTLDFATVIDTDLGGYRHWGVVFNAGSSDVTKKATINVKCGSKSKKNQRNVVFDGGGFLVVWWFESTSGFGVEAVCKQTAAAVGFTPGIVTAYFVAVH